MPRIIHEQLLKVHVDVGNLGCYYYIKMRELVMYATSDNGDGYVTEVGRFADPQDITIRTGLFSKDVVISFDWEGEDEE